MAKAKRYSRSAAQQCRFYEVDNIFEYMAEQGSEKGLHGLSVKRGRADLLERDFERNDLTTH